SRGGEHSLLQQTLLRLARGFLKESPPLVVSNEEHRFQVLEQADAVGARLRDLLLEPEGRNTAPALTAAALRVTGDPVLIMMPADHAFGDDAVFTRCLASACDEAAAGNIALIGAVPSSAETGYGYIRCAAPPGDAAG